MIFKYYPLGRSEALTKIGIRKSMIFKYYHLGRSEALTKIGN